MKKILNYKCLSLLVKIHIQKMYLNALDSTPEAYVSGGIVSLQKKYIF